MRPYWVVILLIALVAVNLLATAIAWNRAEMARDDATAAKAQASTWQQMYKETERECRLAQVEIDAFRIALIREGIELEHGDKP